MTVFTDEFNSVRIESMPTQAPPTVASAKASEVPTLQQATPGFVLDGLQTVRRAAQPVLLISYQAASPANPVTNKSVTESVQRYEYWRTGTDAVITLSGPARADNVDPWRTITDSFRWQR